MADEQLPFADVIDEEDGFSIPELKWRELLFIGALRPEADGAFARDSARPLPPFERGELFPVGARFQAIRRGGRVLLVPAGRRRPRV
jgi:hypothetical protein